MSPLEEIAHAAFSGDAIAARMLVQDWLYTRPVVADVPPPTTPAELPVASITAGLAEMFAERLAQRPPEWTVFYGAVTPPIYLVKAAERMARLRETCRTQGPLPLRRRHVYAPPNYLKAV